MREDTAILPTSADSSWHEVLEHCTAYDVYHLPAYHRLAEELGEGRGSLFVYRHGDHVVALPLLLRPADELAGLTHVGRGMQDACSVYGYPGPLASHDALPERVVRGFGEALRAVLGQQRVVSVFSRLHPLMGQSLLLDGLGQQPAAGTTVSIDLTLSLDAQRARFRSNHKRDINKLRRKGLETSIDRDFARLGEFVRIYHDTMRRVEASHAYFFDANYFRRLASGELSKHVFLCTCTLDDALIAAGLFFACNGIVQYHLGATHDDYLHLAPTKLIFDHVRIWGSEQGLRVLHLGGGVGGRHDSLFHFKAGFSDRTHSFRTWRWIVDPDHYERLSRARSAALAPGGASLSADGFFPAYRAPMAEDSGALAPDDPPMAGRSLP